MSKISIKKPKPKKNKKCWCDGLSFKPGSYVVVVNPIFQREELLKLRFCPECGRSL
jgi:hypothetical protein